jgi:1-deoxy-D-xylulose-5-phosphate reductoisomerase
MTSRKIVLLGSTGSIGRSTLDVVARHPGRFDVCALAANSNVELLADQCRQFRPEYACVTDSSRRDELADRLADTSIKVLAGADDMVALAGLADVDMVINAVVGAAGLRASLRAAESGTSLALANKESLVAGGPLFPPLIKKTGARVLPIDSEHSAIWQALTAGKPDEIRSLIITASGGPFRDYPRERFDEITPEQALNHPTWNMGPKITIDSATLVNKGLEVIEAVALFQVPVDMVKVVVHPQSIIHSMVEFVDSSIIAQMSRPDMRLPITYALFWPDRVQSDYGRMDPGELASLTFEPPDLDRFPALRIAFDVAGTGGTAPAAFNAANEVAVEAFLGNRIRFTQIPQIIGSVVDKLPVGLNPGLGDILDTDRRARELAGKEIGIVAC